MHKDEKESLITIMEEKLEYHDKNLLAGDNKTRSEWKQVRINNAIVILKQIKEN